jgi:monolysocardiolipin acyltransferase
MISALTTPLRKLTTHTLEHLAIGTTGLACYAFAHLFTNTVVHNRETLLWVLDEHYKHNRPIITISNHTSTLDDPLLWGAMLDMK